MLHEAEELLSYNYPIVVIQRVFSRPSVSGDGKYDIVIPAVEVGFRLYDTCMSYCGALKGTLLFNPLVNLTTTYVLLRPFFKGMSGTGEAPMTSHP